MRCPRCGCNNREEQQVCWRCGFGLLPGSPTQTAPIEVPAVHLARPGVVHCDTRDPVTARPLRLTSRRSLWQTLFPPLQELAGTIIHVEPVREERRQRNWGRLASGCLLVVLLLALPLILLRYVFLNSLLLAVGIVLLCIVLFKFIPFAGIFKGLLLLRFLWPRQHDDRVPVQYLRLRDGYQSEHIVRIRGRLQGHIMPGDEIALQGHVRDGVFEMRRGMNLRTGSSFTVRAER